MKKQYFLLLLSLLFGQRLLAQSPIAESATDSVSKPAKYWQIHGENILLGNQSSFTNWAAGGENAMAATLLLNYDFNYNKGRLEWDNKAIIGFGKTFTPAGGWQKTDDRMAWTSNISYELKPSWYASFMLSFLNQFVDGFDYKLKPAKKISAFMAPAYLTLGPGINYKHSQDFKVNLSPIATRFVFVLDKKLSNMGAFGVNKGEMMRYEFGANLDVYYKVNPFKNIELAQTLKLYSNYLNNPAYIDVDYQINMIAKVNNFLSLNVGLQLMYDEDTKTTICQGGNCRKVARLQIKQMFGAGIRYNF